MRLLHFSRLYPCLFAFRLTWSSRERCSNACFSYLVSALQRPCIDCSVQQHQDHPDTFRSTTQPPAPAAFAQRRRSGPDRSHTIRLGGAAIPQCAHPEPPTPPGPSPSCAVEDARAPGDTKGSQPSFQHVSPPWGEGRGTQTPPLAIHAAKWTTDSTVCVASRASVRSRPRRRPDPRSPRQARSAAAGSFQYPRGSSAGTGTSMVPVMQIESTPPRALRLRGSLSLEPLNRAHLPPATLRCASGTRPGPAAPTEQRQVPLQRATPGPPRPRPEPHPRSGSRPPQTWES